MLNPGTYVACTASKDNGAIYGLDTGATILEYYQLWGKAKWHQETEYYLTKNILMQMVRDSKISRIIGGHHIG